MSSGRERAIVYKTFHEGDSVRLQKAEIGTIELKCNLGEGLR
jgi:hypothetical protein